MVTPPRWGARLDFVPQSGGRRGSEKTEDFVKELSNVILPRGASHIDVTINHVGVYEPCIDDHKGQYPILQEIVSNANLVTGS
ncbi:hypothetical protein JTB14_007194 [Gonioctena quinquepunctata]|nr:hypothetical protein JTB14_007194 [Gonioctena quinquepunctata]